MTSEPHSGQTSLKDLGWTNMFAQQLDIEEYQTALPCRILAQHRSGITAIGQFGHVTLSPIPESTVGDWILIDAESRRTIRVLDRKSELKRRSAGSERDSQLIAANVDTLFIVSSCNADFNPARIERYLALAQEAEVIPVVVLTKADLVEDPGPFIDQAKSLMPDLCVECLDARDFQQTQRLLPWCDIGQTVALVGSSGVGKSTLVNALLADNVAATQGIREDDAKGRHTTTHRQLHRMAHGGWLMDMPGMRELGLTEAQDGIDSVFADLAALARTCSFTDCAHDTEPGCAVKAAIAAGTVDADRLKRWRKLQSEDRRNTETIAQRNTREKLFAREVKKAMKKKQR